MNSATPTDGSYHKCCNKVTGSGDFGCLKSIIRLEDSYLVISVSPESSA